MKERKVAIDWEKLRIQEVNEAVEEEKRDVDKEEQEKEQSLDVKSQIDWWDTRVDEEPDPRVAKCLFAQHWKPSLHNFSAFDQLSIRIYLQDL